MQILYFTSSTCTPCKKFLPTVLDIQSELNIGLKILSKDTHNTVFDKYTVLSVPTIVVTANDSPVWSHTGTKTYRELLDKLTELKERYEH